MRFGQDTADGLATEEPEDLAADADALEEVDEPRSGLNLRTFLWPVFTLIVLGSIWELISRTGVVNEIVLPPPSEVFSSGADVVQRGYFWDATWVTLQEAIAGFAIGCGIAWALGTLIGFSRPVRYSLYPLVIAFQNTPRVAFFPLFIIWFGFGLSSKIFMAASLCFFPVLIAVVVGMATVDKDARTLMRSMGASRWQTYRKLELPASLPILFSGLKQAMTLALIGAIVGEFVGGNEGLGVLIKEFNFQLNVAEGFFVIIVLSVMGLALYGLVEWIDKRVVFWREAD